MPVNYQQLRQQISALGANWQQWNSRREQEVNSAKDLFRRYRNANDDLQQIVTEALAGKPDLRCAIPTAEPLDLAVDGQAFSTQAVVMAADGSQIVPSRHDSIEFGLLNIGAIRMPMNVGAPTTEQTHTELLVLDQLQTPQGKIQEDLLSLQRDMLERRLIASLAGSETLPVVALTDGPLEPYNKQRQDAEFDRALREYGQSLQELDQRQVAAAGYVDRPGSDLVVRMLELAWHKAAGPVAGGAVGMPERPLKQVLDLDLFSGLQPGQRSAIFELSSPVTRKLAAQVGFYFFYLRLGSVAASSLARVEVPGWVAKSTPLINLVHSVLLHQASQLGGQPYPYVLHRAHEIALVTFEEKERIEMMLVQELIKAGVPARGKSAKSGYKSQVGAKTRYKR